VRVQRAFAALLCLYPRDYRALFGREMHDAFAAAAAAHGGRGSTAFMTFVVSEFLAALRGAAAEWAAKIRSDRAGRGRVLPDPRMMRPAGILRHDWLRNL